jgi:hypothetical protein
LLSHRTATSAKHKWTKYEKSRRRLLASAAVASASLHMIKKNRINRPRLLSQSDSKTTDRISDKHQHYSFLQSFLTSPFYSPQNTRNTLGYRM